MSADDWSLGEQHALAGKLGASAQRMANAHRTLENAMREYARAKDAYGSYTAIVEGNGAARCRAFGMQDEHGNEILSERFSLAALEARSADVMVTDWLISLAVFDPNVALVVGEDRTQFQVAYAPTSTPQATLGLIEIVGSHAANQIVVEG